MFPELKSIERRRRQLGLTQKQLALSCQVSQSLVAKVERGLLVPSYDIACRIFTFLDSAEKRDEKLAKDIMHKGVICVNAGEKVYKVAALLKKHRISQTPVIEHRAVVGSVSAKDIIDAPKRAEIRDFVNDPFPTVGSGTPVSIVKELLRHHSAVLVVDKAIKGIITAEDFL